MQKINWKIVNIAFWIEIILAYILPFKVIDNFQYVVGFPITFIRIYDAEIGLNPLTSMHLNPISFILNGIIIYLLLSVCLKAIKK